jgi:hypothetical protein
VPLEQCWELAKRWYKGREELDWLRPAPAELRKIFREVGLLDPFWEIG